MTFNLKDFPNRELKQFGIEAVHPEDFLLDQLDLQPGSMLAALERQAARYRRTPRTVPGVLGILDRTGLSGFAAEVRRWHR